MRAYCDAHLAVPIYISSSIHIQSISYTTSCTFVYSFAPPTYKYVNIYMHTDVYTYVHTCINTQTHLYTHV